MRDSSRFVKREASQMGYMKRVPTMVLSEAQGLWLFSVIRGGIGLTLRLREKHDFVPTGILDTLPRTERFRESTQPAPDNLPRHRFSPHAQAACCFSSCGSKRTPFFQTVKTIDAIFRANVRRAIDGFIPLASKFR